MNFKGHFTGGIIIATVVATVAIITTHSNIDQEVIKAFIEHPFRENPLQTPVFIFAIVWFMALFPDLDTASIIQRWFYRALLVLLLILMINKQYDYFIVLSFVAVLPLIDKHRGWTHWKTAPWLISIFLAIVFEHIRAKNAWFFGFKWENVLGLIKHYWIYILAAVIGHYTHLLLDTPKAKKLSITKWMDQ